MKKGFLGKFIKGYGINKPIGYFYKSDKCYIVSEYTCRRFGIKQNYKKYKYWTIFSEFDSDYFESDVILENTILT